MTLAADQALLPRYGTLEQQHVEEKSRGELVTVADRQSEEILMAGLSHLLPGALLVGEESAHADPQILEHLGGPLCWIIDPLDGTGNYASGSGPFGIMVALCVVGIVVGGWILDPVSGRFCSAARGRGARIDGRPIRIDERERQLAIAALSPLLRTRPTRYEQIVARLAASHELIEIPRCAAAHYPAVVLGAADITLFERTLAWDHAAGVLLVEEAGGHCARFDGEHYRVDDHLTGLLVASSPRRWDETASLLQGLPQ